MASDYGLHWFRRDLRVAGNRALKENWKRHQGRVVGVFCFDKKFLSRPDFSVNRFQFFLESLSKLQEELRQMGSDLLFMDIGPQEAFKKLLSELQTSQWGHPAWVTFSRDYEPFARKRDKELTEFFKEQGVEVKTARDHLLIEPHELSKPHEPGSFYQVYSPFARRWLQLFADEDIQKRVKSQGSALGYLKQRLEGQAQDPLFCLSWKQLLHDFDLWDGILEHYKKENEKQVSVPIPEAGSLKGLQVLEEFKNRIDAYKDKRDFPSVQGTSGVSTFLKNGTLTVPMIVSYLGLEPYKKKLSGRDTYFSELIWREFYYHILFHRPDAETQSFLPQYRELQWENNEAYFEAWKEGRTGFPIVDAAMRGLKQTGWMHNRLRMIVASFLCKDLLIDWRWGEKYFMETLLDGDLAPNNGGWQWAASTGCDPQPYFRIFNPWLQSKKFDPEARFMKLFLPELKDLEAKKFHEPIEHPHYPKPIVEHSVQRDRALALYKMARSE